MAILVTGGLGFIGSHCVVELLIRNHQVIVLDDLSNSTEDIIPPIKQLTGKDFIFYRESLVNANAVESIFQKHAIDWVIHLAGLKSVSESNMEPLKYYQQNIGSTINLLTLMKKYHVKKMIFSSSATVYGNQKPPYHESMATGIGMTNVYAKTKYIIEEILKDTYQADNTWTVVILRYFNPCGAHQSGLIGEDPKSVPTNLMPVILKVADGVYPCLNIYGTDYQTIDGTCIRDFIHVVDLAKGHLVAMERCNRHGVYIYNLGTGKGHSVKEVAETFQKTNNIQLIWKDCGRREGDLAEYYASVEKANRELGWYCLYGLEDMCRDSWRAYRTKKKLIIETI